MLFGIKLEGWLTIAAIVLGPVLAFLVQNWRDRVREDRNRKRRIFHTLLMTLKAQLANAHVDAINSVPLEFYDDKTIVEAWKLYTSHLNNNAMLKANHMGWGQKREELLIDLVHKIGVSLGYSQLDKATLSVNVYTPQGYEDREQQFQEIRAFLLKVLKGQHAIPVTMVGPIQVEEPLPPVQELPVAKPAPVSPPNKIDD